MCRSLRRTTAEIQNYGFERLERATTSKDSGISNMADVEERLEGLTLSNSVRVHYLYAWIFRDNKASSNLSFKNCRVVLLRCLLLHNVEKL